ncbi:MAG TPA: flagellar biosynthetic protein FliO [Acidobacteriaceae bacterium]
MTSLHNWLSKPRTTVRIDTTARWAEWMKLLRRPFAGRQAEPRPRIEVLDRLSLGGKKSLLLIAIEGRRLLVGVGEDAAPSVSGLDEVRRTGGSRVSRAKARRVRGRRIVRA